MKTSFVLTTAVLLLVVAIPVALLMNNKENANASQSADSNRTSTGSQKTPNAGQKTSPAEALDYRLSGPYTHQNLSIFLIHAQNRIANNSFLTLQEALNQKKVVVYETKDVNELTIQNLSDQDLYVQAGEIVKGGQQDRMLGVDLIVPAKSSRIPIAAFCVEHGRWTQRGDEKVYSFSTSADVAATKELKMAARAEASQQAVWDNVKIAQDKLSKNVGERVNSSVSESSLQLAVENQKVKENSEAYINALNDIVKGKSDVIGYVFAINGKVNSADVYASNALFAKLWPKLLKANAVEAIAELQKENNFEPVSETSVKTFLVESEKAEAIEKDVNSRVKLVTREDSSNMFFETRDEAKKGEWVHRSYIKKN